MVVEPLTSFTIWDKSEIIVEKASAILRGEGWVYISKLSDKGGRLKAIKNRDIINNKNSEEIISSLKEDKTVPCATHADVLRQAD